MIRWNFLQYLIFLFGMNHGGYVQVSGGFEALSTIFPFGKIPTIHHLAVMAFSKFFLLAFSEIIRIMENVRLG